MGPDGALYISDDWHGRIWRVTYHGDPNAKVTAAPSPKTTATISGEPGPPPRASIPKPDAWRRCPSRLVPHQIKSSWAGASSMARLRAEPASAVMATMQKVRRRHRRPTLANRWIAAGAFQRP